MQIKSSVNTVVTDLASYKTVKGTKKQVVGIKSSTLTDLEKKTGITSELLKVIQNAAKLIPGTIHNINQITNKLKDASGYVADYHELYLNAISTINIMSRDKVKLN